MIGVPVKDCAPWLSRFCELLDDFKDVSRVVFSYGKSQDQTYLVLKEWADKTDHNVEIYQEPAMKAVSAAEIAPIYKDFQQLITPDETHFMLIDSDITQTPKNLVQLLKKQKKDIIAPYVWIRGRHPLEFYDVEIFRLNGYRFHSFRPPKPEKPFQLDSVGSCYLASHEAFTMAQFDNPHPHMVFCENARELGFKVWADPRISIYHLDLARVGIIHFPLEYRRGEPVDRTPFIKEDGSVISFEQMKRDYARAYLWGET